jgi:hypothetical protein
MIEAVVLVDPPYIQSRLCDIVTWQKTNQRRSFKTVFSKEAISDFAWVITSDTLPEK